MRTLAKTGPKITCTDVSLSIGRNQILKNISISAEPGKIHCIIGPNGGGKSSLIRSMLGQMRHTGEIALTWVDDDRTIGYVPQVVAVDKTMPLTVRDFLTLCVQNRPAVLGLKKAIRPIVAEVLEEVRLAGKEKFLFSDLSGGERQRVLFAQALIPRPRLLILDEPMNSIDRGGADIFSAIIRKAASEGTTVLWVHHDLAQVREVADTVTCINRRLVFSGPPSEVMNEKHLYDIFAASSDEGE